nr:hypothetical protein [uncultured Chryseobacterium sp.]
MKNKLLLMALIIKGTLLFYSQQLHSSLQLRNSHLWRGLEVSSGLIYTGDLHLDGKNFYAGFWAGGNADGSYKEFDNYIGYRSKHFTAELWDIYNFSPGASYNNREFFNYKGSETGRFWDLRTYYTVSNRIPLVLSANTVVFGRDRNRENTHNKYSSFVSAEYPVYLKKDENLEIRARAGYGLALRHAGEKSNFFAEKDGLNEISLILSKSFFISGYKIPVGIWGMWNPVGNNAYLQFSVQAYSF